jgi:type I restriction enzyme S subunit
MKRYDSYKDSGIEWIGEIPSHWEINKFGRATFFQEGPGLRNWQFTESGIKVICVTNIVPPYIDFSKMTKYISEEEYETTYKHFTVNKGDIMLASSGASWGKVAEYIEEETVILNTSTIRLNEAENKKVKKEFIKWVIQSAYISESLNILLTGSCQPNFGPTHLNKLTCVYPISVEEQTTIANYLDQKTTQIDDLIAKKERLIQLLEEERIAIINQAVTKGLDTTVPMKDSGIEWLGEIPAHWEVKKLKQIFNSSKGLTITKDNLESEGIPCVNYGEIHSKFGFEVDIDKHQLKCVNPSYLESDFKSLIQTGDFVFADTSEDVSGAGNFTYLKSNHEIFAGYHTIVLRAFCDIEPRYFAYQFDSIPYRTQIRKSVKGIKVFSITQGILKNTSLWIPTLEEQKQIIKFLDIETDRIVSIKNSTRKEIELLKEYKTALISEVVTGKVDVRNEKLK